MTLSTIENAVAAWVVTATGLSLGSQVFFANQGVEQPQSGPFVTIEVGGDVVPLGSVDEVQSSTNLSNPPGTEVTLAAVGRREVGVTLQAFGYQTVSGGQGGGITAVQALTTAQTLLSRPDVRGALLTAGIAPYDNGQVQRADAVVETGFEGRAILHVRFYATDEQTMSTGYIDEVQATGTLTNPDGSTETVSLDTTG